MYVCLYKEQATRKENRELCVTVPHKNNVGMYNSNDFRVFNLWYAYVIMKCFTSKQNKNKICTYNEQMACILTRSSDLIADSSSCEVFNLVWVVYQSRKINECN